MSEGMQHELGNRKRKIIAAYDIKGIIYGMAAFKNYYGNQLEIKALVVNPESIKAIGKIQSVAWELLL